MKQYLYISICCFVVAIISLLFIGCGGGGSSDVATESTYNAKIKDWQSREASTPAIETTCSNTGNIALDIIRILNQLPHFNMFADPGGDYWQTSEESMKLLTGDCEDVAILAYRVIMDSCLPDNYDIDIRIRVLDDSPTTDHAVTIIYYGTETLEINNLILRAETNLFAIVEFDQEFIF